IQDMGKNFAEKELFSIDLTTGKKETYQTKHMQKLLPYTDQSFLAVVYDQENAYDYNLQKMISPEVMIFTPQKDEAIAYCTLPHYDTTGIAYAQAQETLYYTVRDQLYKLPIAKGDETVKPEEREELVGYITNYGTFFEQKAWVTPSNHYLLWRGWNDGIVDHDLSLEIPATTVSISGVFWEQDNLAFTQQYPDVPVVQVQGEEGVDTQDTKEFAKALTSGIGKADIYIVDPYVIDLETLAKEGIIYPLADSDIITANVEKMYPYIQEALMVEQIPYALPYSIQPSGSISYFPINFSVVGFTQEELPRNYMELLMVLEKWERELKKANPQYHFLSGRDLTKELIFYDLLSAYTQYYEKAGLPLTFDTESFRNITKKAEETTSYLPKKTENHLE
ncbi:MAG: hypothetical protein GX786_01930, partial [Clostridiales bacterium]|nr:hypothetical protein [Clostridiales bacterium]